MGEEARLKTCVILPAYNEAQKLAEVIGHISKVDIDVLVVDDGSIDATRSIAEDNGAFVISHTKRKGKGISLRDGLEYAKAKNYGFIVTMDADGQHDPTEIPLFIRTAKNGNADVVIGNRFPAPSGMPLVRFLTNKFMSLVISLICRQHILDSQCGFRLFRVSCLKGIDIETHKFEIESEMLIKLAKKGCRIISVPIRSIYADEKSRINPISDTVRFIRFVIKILLKGNRLGA